MSASQYPQFARPCLSGPWSNGVFCIRRPNLKSNSPIGVTMAIALKLEWAKCPDGYEIYERAPPEYPPGYRPTILEMAGNDGERIRPKSKRSAPLVFSKYDDRKLVVTEFMRAESCDAILEFCNKYGLPMRRQI